MFCISCEAEPVLPAWQQGAAVKGRLCIAVPRLLPVVKNEQHCIILASAQVLLLSGHAQLICLLSLQLCLQLQGCRRLITVVCQELGVSPADISSTSSNRS